MSPWLENLITTGISLLVLIVVVGGSLMLYAYYAFNYWKRKGVKSLPPYFPCGNVHDCIMQNRTFGEVFKEIYDITKLSGDKYAGAYCFFRPVFVPVDLNIIKQIYHGAFAHFSDRGFYVNVKSDPLTGNLFSLGSYRWRFLRSKLTPTFTSSKMRMMFDTITTQSENLVNLIRWQAALKLPINTKDVLARFNTDVIGSCAFGIQSNSLFNPETILRYYGEKVFKPRLRGLFELAVPRYILQAVGFRSTPRDIETYFRDMIKFTVALREARGEQPNDFLNLLIQLKNVGKVGPDIRKGYSVPAQDKITMDELIAQCYVFFLAGFETSSTTTAFALFELALNPEIQEAAREEVNRVLGRHGQIIYDTIAKMTYLEQIINETLRKYPPLPVITRMCTEDYRIEGTSLVIKEGTSVFIPALGFHYDPEYFPDPYEFKPERFDKKVKRDKDPFTYMPFGHGPRVCIGIRFGMTQVKVALASILRNFRITLNERTQMPLQFEPSSFILTVKGGIWVNMEPIEEKHWL